MSCDSTRCHERNGVRQTLASLCAGPMTVVARNNDDRFASDEYIAQQQVRSVLCMPLMNQGKISAILYLENNLSPGAFDPDRLTTLEILSSLMATSLDKARLYSDLLEHRGDLASLVDELERRDLETGLVTLCIGAGMGTATIVERV